MRHADHPEAPQSEWHDLIRCMGSHQAVQTGVHQIARAQDAGETPDEFAR
jgi:hypothetical protein